MSADRLRSMRRRQRHDAARFFPLRLDEVLVAVHAGERRDRTMGPLCQEHGTPAGERRPEGDGGEGVTEIVLAVTEGSLAVLPCFAPVDGGERDQHEIRVAAHRCRPCALIERAAQLERLPIRRVMVHSRRACQARHSTTDDVCLGRVEVAARRIHAQRPPRSAELLPRREPKRMPEHVAECGRRQRRRRARGIEEPVVRDGSRKIVADRRGRRRVQGKGRSPAVGAERVRLRRPVQISKRLGEPVEVMLRAVVVMLNGRPRVGESQGD